MKSSDLNRGSRVPVPSAGSPEAGVTRRAFLKGLGTTAVAAAAASAHGVAKELEQTNAERIAGPEPGPVTLMINGEKRTFQLEPRTTLLEALREHAGLTGTKEGCDRASCGACTVLLDDIPVYACSLLAIEGQGAEITTIEGLAESGELTALQQALVDQDGLQCGFCSPGFVLSLTALLRRNPHPTEAEVRLACSGNLCRCGSYSRIFAAALKAAGVSPASRTQIVRTSDHVLA